MPEPGEPRQEVAAAVCEARQGALHFVEVSVRVVRQGVTFAGRQCAQARSHLVASCADGLERGARLEADRALDAVDLDRGG